jgi:hypothetical protein
MVDSGINTKERPGGIQETVPCMRVTSVSYFLRKSSLPLILKYMQIAELDFLCRHTKVLIIRKAILVEHGTAIVLGHDEILYH